MMQAVVTSFYSSQVLLPLNFVIVFLGNTEVSNLRVLGVLGLTRGMNVPLGGAMLFDKFA